MARTFEQIDTEITSAIAADTNLNGLNSTSQVSLWKLFKDAIAQVLQVNDQLQDAKLLELNRIADEAVAGTSYWLRRKVYEFQYGDQLQVNTDFSVGYPSIDTSKNIITRVSVKQLEDSRDVLVKVAKGDTTLTPLAPTELAALKAYINKLKFAGTIIRPISLTSDFIAVNAEIYYFAEYIEADVKAAVIVALNNFLKTLEFDGTMYLTKLVDALQLVPGVKDVRLISAVARPYTTDADDTSLQPIERIYETNSGYLVADTTTGYTPEETITMIPAYAQ
jgi:hypothetical protein